MRVSPGVGSGLRGMMGLGEGDITRWHGMGGWVKALGCPCAWVRSRALWGMSMEA